MQCAKFEQRLQQLLDGHKNVEQDEMLREHSQGCDSCSSVLRTQTRLFTGLKSLPEPCFAQDLGPRVLDQLRIDQRKRTNKRLVIAALATAAAIFIALLPFAGNHVRFRPNAERGGGLAIATTVPRQVPGIGRDTPGDAPADATPLGPSSLHV
jgi:predicted anti-sigma-YlaC factor YlaD